MEHTNQMGILYLVITHTKFLQLTAPRFKVCLDIMSGGEGPWLQSRW